MVRNQGRTPGAVSFVLVDKKLLHQAFFTGTALVNIAEDLFHHVTGLPINHHDYTVQ